MSVSTGRTPQRSSRDVILQKDAEDKIDLACEQIRNGNIKDIYMNIKKRHLRFIGHIMMAWVI